MGSAMNPDLWRCLLTCVLLASSIASAQPHPKETVTVEQVLTQHGRPSFVLDARALCLAYHTPSERSRAVRWFVQPRDSDGWEVLTQDTKSAEAERVVDACGRVAGTYLRAVEVTCDQEKTRNGLSTPELLSLHAGTLPEGLERRLQPYEKGFWQAAEELGCARVVTTPDDRVRIWTVSLERLNEDEPPSRGEAWIQWRTPEGAVKVARAPDDLHLDTIVDQVSWIPRSTDAVLVVGLRSGVAKFAGEFPQRYAQILSLGEEIRRVRGKFTVRKKRLDVLLLRAPVPETGKFRHSALANLWLKWDPQRKLLRVEPVPDAYADRLPPVTDPVVARWKEGRFVVMGESWNDIRLDAEAPKDW